MARKNSEEANEKSRKSKEQKAAADKVSRWLKELAFVQDSKAQTAFEKHGEKIVKIYRNADALQPYVSGNAANNRVMFNVLWSNVQIKKPLLYARTPKVVVERRHRDANPVTRLACTIAERCATFAIMSQQDRFNFVIRSAVEDRLLPGRGVAWVRYDPDFGESADTDKVSGPELGEATEAEESTESESVGDDAQEMEAQAPTVPMVTDARVIWDYVHWLDFFHSTARNPYELRWVSKRAYMTRNELVDRFGEEIGNAVELKENPTSKTRKKLSDDEKQMVMQAEVYEIWDLATKSVIWISDGYEDGPLDEEADPLKLDGFWPCPVPLYATTTTDSLYPTPDYKIYEALADELDYVTKRVSSMVGCVRYVGAHAASLGADIKNILKLNDGETWPIPNWQAFTEQKGGLQGAINWFPFDRAVEALPTLWQHQQNLLNQINDITGIPDIVRGATDPTETAAAIQRKSKWTMLKAAAEQSDVQRFVRELISKGTQIIFEPGLFPDQTIGLMCGAESFAPDEQALYPQALELLRNDRMRTFKIDIETDSTIAIDEDEDQRQRMEYMQTMTQLVSAVQSVAQFRPELMQPMIQSAMFAVRAFRTGRELEGSWERAMREIEDADAQAKANPPQPPPDPAMLRAQIEGQKAQADAQFTAQELQLKAQELAQSFEIESQKLNIEAQKVFSKQQMDQMDAELKQFKEQFAQWAESQRLELERVETVLSEREKMIEESRLKHEQTLEAIRMVNDRVVEGAAPKERQEPPVVNVHLGGKAKRAVTRRTATGELVSDLVELD